MPSVKTTSCPTCGFVAPGIDIAVTVNASFSISVSFDKIPFATEIVNGVSSLVVFTSATATGASFTGVTDNVNVLVAVFVPSVIV